MTQPGTISAESFFHRLIDYAGLFPPTSLSMDEAFSLYLKYLNSGHRWMLSKFICPFGRTGEIAAHQEILKLNKDDRIELSMITSGAQECSGFISNLKKEIADFLEITLKVPHFRIESIEFKLPLELTADPDVQKISAFLDALTDCIKEELEHRIFLFCELPVNKDFSSSVRQLASAIQMHNVLFNDTGFKLRTGGTDATDFPEPEMIVKSIRACLNHNVAMKFTAGMHHPVRFLDSGLNVKRHGFINVFGAGIVAFRHAISDHELTQMIEEEDPSSFRFNNEYFEWKDWKCTIEEIHGARNNLVISYGSCSFEEPVSDLIHLNVIN